MHFTRSNSHQKLLNKLQTIDKLLDAENKTDNEIAQEIIRGFSMKEWVLLQFAYDFSNTIGKASWGVISSELTYKTWEEEKQK